MTQLWGHYRVHVVSGIRARGALGVQMTMMMQPNGQYQEVHMNEDKDKEAMMMMITWPWGQYYPMHVIPSLCQITEEAHENTTIKCMWTPHLLECSHPATR